ncbi:hypothetical protein BS17DRAFT_331775 [Gyrodon lividus]|nr:hypothetical protein BS17DRAFT_331775 [Gyrodon lividus]
MGTWTCTCPVSAHPVLSRSSDELIACFPPAIRPSRTTNTDSLGGFPGALYRPSPTLSWTS